MKEKDIIKEAVRREWDKLTSFEKNLVCDAKETEEQRIRWLALDELWCTLYDEEY